MSNNNLAATKPIRKQILDNATNICYNKREADYGDPSESFTRTAGMLSAHFKYEFTADDVAQIMIILKLSRLRTSPNKADHWVDIAGYAACGAEAANVIIKSED